MPYICDSTAPVLPFESPLWAKGQREHKALGSHSEYSNRSSVGFLSHCESSRKPVSSKTGQKT